MLTPSQLQKAGSSIAALFLQLEADILAEIARLISHQGFITSDVAYQQKKLKETQSFLKLIEKHVAGVGGKAQKETVAAFLQLQKQNFKVQKAIFAEGGADFTISQSMRGIVEQGLASTLGTMNNLTGTMIVSSRQTYIAAADRAFMQVKSGAFSAEMATRNAVQYLASEGIRIASFDARTDNIDVAVRRNIRTGVSSTAGKVNYQAAVDNGVSLVETTAHIGARPEHAAWQGKIFAFKGKSGKYPDFIKATGYGDITGIAGINCRHQFYAYFEGASEKSYGQNELKELNNTKWSFMGEEITPYEATQLQRKGEVAIRNLKRQIAMEEAAGLANASTRQALGRAEAAQASLIKNTPLTRRKDLEVI